jgi:shikimate dehydrogenase
VNAATRLVGILGWPVAHSLSPVMHNAAFAALGLDYAYVALPVPPARVAEAVAGLRALGFRGANVTVPHKQAVVPFLDELDAEARLAGAVNTVLVTDDGRLLGANTDIAGFAGAFAEASPEDLTGREALLFGAGGAARAAAVWLGRAGADVTVTARDGDAAAAVVELVRAAGRNAAARSLPLAELTAEHVTRAALIVNATTLGMPGAGKVPPLFVDNVRRDHVVFDVVYARQPTQLIAQARQRGARAIDGLSMLIWQAGAAFEIWTGRAAPLEVMRSAVTR